LLFSSIAVAAPASTDKASAPADNEQIAQLLDQLSVRALLEQAPAVLIAATEAEAQFRQTSLQSANWRRELEAQFKPQSLQQEVARYLRDRYRADTFRQAQQRLQEPLAKRVRYFDFAMTQSGAEKNLREALAAHKAEHSDDATDESGSASRRALLGEIDTATASSLLTATLQSAIAARVKQAAGSGVIDAAALQAEIAERQRYLAPLTIDYLFYDYRYLRDDELRDYRDLMRDETVQWLLDVCRQALLAAIVGELTPPPNPPR